MNHLWLEREQWSSMPTHTSHCGMRSSPWVAEYCTPRTLAVRQMTSWLLLHPGGVSVPRGVREFQLLSHTPLETSPPCRIALIPCMLQQQPSVFVPEVFHVRVADFWMRTKMTVMMMMMTMMKMMKRKMRSSLRMKQRTSCQVQDREFQRMRKRVLMTKPCQSYSLELSSVCSIRKALTTHGWREGDPGSHAKLTWEAVKFHPAQILSAAPFTLPLLQECLAARSTIKRITSPQVATGVEAAPLAHRRRLRLFRLLPPLPWLDPHTVIQSSPSILGPMSLMIPLAS